MKDILMLVHFNLFPWETGNGRFHYIANMLCENGASVEMVTSSFYHSTKSQRVCSEEQLQTLPYKVTFAYEPDYPKNVCLKRLSSHKKFAKSVKKYLQTRKVPDLIYCAVPSLDAACVAAKYCKKYNIKFVIDIQDLWPEAFKMVFHMPIVSSVVFAPMQRKANKVYKAADKIIAVSETYAKRGMKVNKKGMPASVVYLGTDKDRFDNSAEVNAVSAEKEDALIKLAYAGTLGSSYDLETVFEALRKMDEEELAKIKFVIMGDGPKREQFKKTATELPVVFTGALPYENMVHELTLCDIAINPIAAGSAGSIINKHMDYAMAGLPVINTQECEEYRNLLDRYACGINCECGNANEVAEAIRRLLADENLRKEMGEQSRKMGEELFDRKSTYYKITDAINGMLDTETV